MKTGKLKKFETVAAPGIIADTPEEFAAFIDELLLIAERMPGAITNEPTKIISGAVASEPTKIISGAVASEPTKNNSVDAEKPDEILFTAFNSSELAILEKLKNGEQ
jgi:hypothetical protein